MSKKYAYERQPDHRDTGNEQKDTRDSKTIFGDTMREHLHVIETSTGPKLTAEINHIGALYGHLSFVADTFYHEIERVTPDNPSFEKTKELAHKYIEVLQQTLDYMQTRLSDTSEVKRDISQDEAAYQTISNTWAQQEPRFNFFGKKERDSYIKGLNNWNKRTVRTKYTFGQEAEYTDEEISTIQEQLKLVQVWLKALLETLENNSYIDGEDFLNKNGSPYAHSKPHHDNPTNWDDKEQPLFGVIGHINKRKDDIEFAEKKRAEEEADRTKERQAATAQKIKKEGTVDGWLEGAYMKSRLPKFLEFGVTEEDLRQKDKEALLKQLKSGYKTLSKKLHPDRGGSNEKFNTMREQYESLQIDLKGRP